jgi:hypothetical protein
MNSLLMLLPAWMEGFVVPIPFFGRRLWAIGSRLGMDIVLNKSGERLADRSCCSYWLPIRSGRESLVERQSSCELSVRVME